MLHTLSNGLNHVLVKQNIMKCVHTNTHRDNFHLDADVKIFQSYEIVQFILHHLKNSVFQCFREPILWNVHL